MAATRPMAVAISASAIPPDTASRPAPLSPMPMKARTMPRVVPSSPTKGAVAPMVASRPMPLFRSLASRICSRSTDRSQETIAAPAARGSSSRGATSRSDSPSTRATCEPGYWSAAASASGMLSFSSACEKTGANARVALAILRKRSHLVTATESETTLIRARKITMPLLSVPVSCQILAKSIAWVLLCASPREPESCGLTGARRRGALLTPNGAGQAKGARPAFSCAPPSGRQLEGHGQGDPHLHRLAGDLRGPEAHPLHHALGRVGEGLVRGVLHRDAFRIHGPVFQHAHPQRHRTHYARIAQQRGILPRELALHLGAVGGRGLPPPRRQLVGALVGRSRTVGDVLRLSVGDAVGHAARRAHAREIVGVGGGLVRIDLRDLARGLHRRHQLLEALHHWRRSLGLGRRRRGRLGLGRLGLLRLVLLDLLIVDELLVLLVQRIAEAGVHRRGRDPRMEHDGDADAPRRPEAPLLPVKLVEHAVPPV